MRYNLQAVNEWEKRATNLIIGIIMNIGMFYSLNNFDLLQFYINKRRIISATIGCGDLYRLINLVMQHIQHIRYKTLLCSIGNTITVRQWHLSDSDICRQWHLSDSDICPTAIWF